MRTDPLPPRPVLGGWHFLAPILALALVRDLWAPDEPRYAQIAREAFESGSLLVLHICGDVYPDKPPLVYWLAGLCGMLGGWSGFALRVPSILATIGSAWIAARIARRHLGPSAAAWTPFFYLGSAMLLWFGGRLQLDPLLAFFVLAAVDLVWTDGGDGPARGRRLLLAGLCAGLAALCKGPVAWLFVGFALLAPRWVPRAVRTPLDFPRAAWAGCVALAVLPVATWATAASLAEPVLWKPLFLGQHLGRATSGDAPHAGPPWEHLWQFPAHVLPWTVPFLAGLVAAGAAWRRARRGESLDDAQRFEVRALVWFAALFVVFSAMPPKRELYLLPLYPVAAWFAARAFAAALDPAGLARATFLRRGAHVTSAIVLLLGLGLGVAPHFVPEAREHAARALPAALLLVAAAGASFAFLARRNLARWADALGLGISAAGVAAAIFVVPIVDPQKSARTLAHEIAALPERPREIPCFGVQPEGYRFYAGVPTVRGANEDWVEAPRREGAAFLALVAERTWDALPADVRARFRIVHRRAVGSRDVLVIGVPR